MDMKNSITQVAGNYSATTSTASGPSTPEEVDEHEYGSPPRVQPPSFDDVDKINRDDPDQEGQDPGSHIGLAIREIIVGFGSENGTILVSAGSVFRHQPVPLTAEYIQHADLVVLDPVDNHQRNGGHDHQDV